MNQDLLKHEMVRLTFSLISIFLAIGIMWFMYPKLMERGSKKQASAYWKAEREANEARLFGGDDGS